MKPTRALPLLLALAACPNEAECPVDESVDTTAVRVATRSVAASLAVLADAFVDVDVDVVAQRKLNAKAENSYAPWDVDEPDEAAVSNPIYEQGGLGGQSPLFGGQGLAAPLGDEIPTWDAAATPAELAAARDRAAAWQGVFAGLVAAEQVDPAWEDPTVNAAMVGVWMDLVGARCVLASLAAGTDEALDVCTASADVLAATTALVALADVTRGLAEVQATRHATLTTIRDLAVAFREAVDAVHEAGDARTLAQALVDEANAARVATDPTTGVAGLPEVLAREVPTLDTGMDELRRALRDATLHTAAHEAAHVVQQRGAALDAVLAQDGGFDGCDDLHCAVSSARVMLHKIHRGEKLPSVIDAARAAFAAAADKDPVPEAKAALLAALRDAEVDFADLRDDEDRLRRQLQTGSTVLRSRHDAWKSTVNVVR